MLEWHAFLATESRRFTVVGRVEAVDHQGIRLTEIDPEAGPLEGSEVYVEWEEIVLLAVSGPDSDKELFAMKAG